MAIVATEQGGIVACQGGPQGKSEQAGIKALSWEQLNEIARNFEALNPYDREAVPGSILKIEADNFDPKTRKQRQLYCLAISAKRYALFLKNEDGAPVLLRKGVNNDSDRWSEHGLGHLLNPTDPDSEDREWIAAVWLGIIRRALGSRTPKLTFADLPAVGRVTVSSPAVMRPLTALNDGKHYTSQIKPFNFLLTCHVKKLGHPAGAKPERFHLIGPYKSDPRQWLKRATSNRPRCGKLDIEMNATKTCLRCSSPTVCLSQVFPSASAVIQGNVTGMQTDLQVDQMWDRAIGDSGRNLSRIFASQPSNCGTARELQKRGAASQAVATWESACEQALTERTKFDSVFKRIIEQRAELKAFQTTAESHRQALADEAGRIQ
jgi:hypothetical protein